ncbi:hypothetical protein QE152_g7959 [Popillia japonica]|uniref:Endonuclease-reverse transcriptase n=1 Tax=Popillia japonica TaxID=7064 RepID=A0AAW1M6A5_POPJA
MLPIPRLSTGQVDGVKTRKRRNDTRARINWEEFKVTVEMIDKNLDYARCARIIQQACKNSTETCKPGNNDPYWWNTNIAKKRAVCNLNRSFLTRANKKLAVTGGNINEARESKRELCKLIKQAKMKYWVDLCNKLNNNIWGDAYRIVTKKLKQLTPYELTPDQKLQIVAELFKPAIDSWNDDDIEPHSRLFSEGELRIAAGSMKTNRAPGPDRIPLEAIKEVKEHLAVY